MVSGKSSSIEEWERQRRLALASLQDILDRPELDMYKSPLELLSTLDEFVTDQEYEKYEEDDWLWLLTMIAAFVAQVLIVEYEATWQVVQDERGTNYLLAVAAEDGTVNCVSPLDVVYEEMQRATLPLLIRILGNAELGVGVGDPNW